MIAITAVASIDGASRVAAYLMAGYVLAMVLNAVVPHALLSIAMRRTMPGTATALLLNLPLGLWYLRRALLLGRIEERVFFWAGPAVVVLLLWSIRPLFALSRSFLGHRRRSQ